ncbi:cupin domain-containing protein [Hydrogenophaga sp. SL48]|jgi:quercetin dioxygenase-like cupin family protein|uniref:cupin domain-containing protein n=1 Tax=Hydrogenophaga sp. SL48 TaxID=2806347 RepID=UPI001F1E913F|nr:cupin domain-containing protein [Hydrogenophaga sp. SL48]UJW79444.1 cupin domain-containing protein [Hydrogenophaga sp. SL48]
MKVTRFADAKPYVAPNHYEMVSLRLQGFEADGPEKFWTGLSHFLPGGGAGPDSSPLEKVYVLLSGELTVRAAGQEIVLGPMDSCCIPGGEEREVKNTGNHVASMLVVMPYPESSK